MFAARTAFTTREVYLTLSEKLRELFQSEEGCVITLAMGVDPADDRCLKLLARVSTLGVYICRGRRSGNGDSRSTVCTFAGEGSREWR